MTNTCTSPGNGRGFFVQKTFAIIIFYLDTNLDRRYKFPITWKKVEIGGK
jgi:hypothetical protein